MYAVRLASYHHNEFLEISDRICNVSLANRNSHPFMVLASQPCSGSIWIRKLLEQVTGIYTGSFEHDKNLYDAGFLGELEEWESGTTLIMEKHGSRNPDDDERFEAVVLLLRNPYDAFLCERNVQLTGSYAASSTSMDGNLGNDGQADEDDWREFVTLKASLWRESISSWLTSTRPVMVVRYEDVQDEPEYEIFKMLEFMNVTVDETRLHCLQQVEFEESIHRPEHEYSHLEFYNQELRELVEENIKAMYELLDIHVKGFPQDWKI
ncbi:sialate:O-sulfotransferase 1-like [Glandiceps talaboti]